MRDPVRFLLGRRRMPAPAVHSGGQSRLDRDAAGARAEQQQRLGSPIQELVDGVLRPLPVAVVIENQNASGNQPLVKMFQFVLRRLVPVGVQTQDRYLLRGVLGNSFLDRSFHEMATVRRVRDQIESLPYVIACRDRTHKRITDSSSE